MLKLAADENLDARILHGLRRRDPAIDVVRVQDAGLAGLPDPALLEWAASEGRVFVTHDVSTVSDFAYQRVAESRPMPGVIEIPARTPIGKAIEDLLLVATASDPADVENVVLHLPL